MTQNRHLHILRVQLYLSSASTERTMGTISSTGWNPEDRFPRQNHFNDTPPFHGPHWKPQLFAVDLFCRLSAFLALGRTDSIPSCESVLAGDTSENILRA